MVGKSPEGPGMEYDSPIVVREEASGASSDEGVAGGGKCAPVHGANGLSVANTA